MDIKKDKYGRPRVYLEEDCPIEEISIECQRERGAVSALPPIYYLHVWWARRPLTISRASIIGSLLPANFDRSDFLQLIGVPKGKSPIEGKKKIAEVKAGTRKDRVIDPYGYERAFAHKLSETELKLLSENMIATWGRESPIVLDSFAGGGSIPFESKVVGFETIANELNPVASLIEIATIDFPSKFGNELAKEIELVGKKINDRIRMELKPCFPRNPGEKDLCYIWIRTIRCKSCGMQMPLAPNWWLDTKNNIGYQLQLPIDQGELCTFKVVEKSNSFDPNIGTVKGGIAICPRCANVTEGSFIKNEAKEGRMGHQLAVIGYKLDGKSGRFFREVSEKDREGLETAKIMLDNRYSDWEKKGYIPNEEIPHGKETSRLHEMGISNWYKLFNDRQLLAHLTTLELICDYPYQEFGDKEKELAIRVYMQMALNKCLNYNAILNVYHPTRALVANVFSRHDFAFVWSYGEIDAIDNLFRFGYEQVVKSYGELAELLGGTKGSCRFTNGDASNLKDIQNCSVDLVSVDPPYYDNVMYSECSDFFYVWEKRGLGALLPDLFSKELTDKDLEAVANPSKFKGSSRSAGKLAAQDYEAKLLSAFKEMRRVLRDEGVLTIMFTHKKVEAWDTLANALLEAGFMITASWPIHTESEHSLHQAKKNAASSTILLVCRKRPKEIKTAWWDDVQIRVDEAVKQKSEMFNESGIRGLDAFIACFGPALEVISESWPVKRKDGTVIRPDEALDRARNIVSEWFMKKIAEGNAVSLDATTRFYILAWHLFEAREYPYDEGRKLGLSLNVDLDELLRKKIIEKKGEFIRMLKPTDRAKAKGIDASDKNYDTLLDLVQAAICTYEAGQSHELTRFHQRTGALEMEGYTDTIGYLLDVLPRTKEVVEYDILNQMVESSYRDKVKRKTIKRTDLTGRGQVSFNIETGQLIKQTGLDSDEEIDEPDDKEPDEV